MSIESGQLQVQLNIVDVSLPQGWDFLTIPAASGKSKLD
jgi:hypothetical protein